MTNHDRPCHKKNESAADCVTPSADVQTEQAIEEENQEWR